MLGRKTWRVNSQKLMLQTEHKLKTWRKSNSFYFVSQNGLFPLSFCFRFKAINYVSDRLSVGMRRGNIMAT